MGVGKLTVAKLLAEKTGYKLSHNHLFNDLVYSLFDRGTLEANEILEELRYEMYGKAVSMKRSFIMTHAYSHNFVSLTGQTDPQYLKNLQDKMGSAGAKTYFVHLKADDEVLLERVSQESRKEFGKLTDIEIMKGYLHTKDFKSSPEMWLARIFQNSP